MFLFNPNVASPLRGKTRQSAPDVDAHRLGQDEQYLTVREILSEVSTVANGELSREQAIFAGLGMQHKGLIQITRMHSDTLQSEI